MPKQRKEPSAGGSSSELTLAQADERETDFETYVGGKNLKAGD